MTERGRASLHRQASTLHIGPSGLRWDGEVLSFDIDEVTMPVPSSVRGTVRVYPRVVLDRSWALDAAGRHRWAPLAPSARVEVQMTSPDLSWSGEAYCDSNSGDEALERRIRSWNWSRGRVREGSAVIYDVVERSGEQTTLALCFGRDGSATEFAAAQRVAHAPSRWRIARGTRSEDGRASIARTLEDTPFYARSIVDSRLLDQPTRSVHESLDLDRFRSPIVQAMLPFRMPRKTGVGSRV